MTTKQVTTLATLLLVLSGCASATEESDGEDQATASSDSALSGNSCSAAPRAAASIFNNDARFALPAGSVWIAVLNSRGQILGTHSFGAIAPQSSAGITVTEPGAASVQFNYQGAIRPTGYGCYRNLFGGGTFDAATLYR